MAPTEGPAPNLTTGHAVVTSMDGLRRGLLGFGKPPWRLNGPSGAGQPSAPAPTIWENPTAKADDNQARRSPPGRFSHMVGATGIEPVTSAV